MLAVLGVAGCAQERLTVADTCAEYDTIINMSEADALVNADQLADLADRAALPLEKPISVAATFFENGGSGVAEWTDADVAAEKQLSETCPSG